MHILKGHIIYLISIQKDKIVSINSIEEMKKSVSRNVKIPFLACPFDINTITFFILLIGDLSALSLFQVNKTVVRVYEPNMTINSPRRIISLKTKPRLIFVDSESCSLRNSPITKV